MPAEWKVHFKLLFKLKLLILYHSNWKTTPFFQNNKNIVERIFKEYVKIKIQKVCSCFT